MISHTNSIPAFWKTLFRTNSPNPSRSAALAPPVLIIKLECFSLICAPPRVAPRRPASSITFHAFRSCVSSARPVLENPAGLRNVLPALRSLVVGFRRVCAVVRPFWRAVPLPHRGGAKHCLGNDGTVWNVGLTIFKGNLFTGQRDDFTLTGDKCRLNKVIGHIGSITPRIHPHGPADGSRDCAQECQIAPLIRRTPRHMGIKRRRTRDD